MNQSLTDIVIEIQYDEFVSFVNEHKLTETTQLINEIIIPGKLKKVWGFIKDLKGKLSVKLKDLVKLFMDKVVFKFFAKIKFSMEYLFKLVKKGFKAYKEVIKAIGEYVASTKVGKWTEEKLKDLDAFLEKHPRTKKIAGLAVAGILVYIWLNMTFTGNADYDFDIGDMIMALGGGYIIKVICWTRRNGIADIVCNGYDRFIISLARTTTYAVYRGSIIWFSKNSWKKTN